MARTCGDEIESSWSQTNVLGASVREMASGGRHETLNDHFNGANVRKVVNLRKLCILFTVHTTDSLGANVQVLRFQKSCARRRK